jgi:hypothetical protein
MSKVNPRCRSNWISPYLNAEGILYPCCWLGNIPFNLQLKEFLGDLFEELKKENALSGPAMDKLAGTWENGTFQPCVIFCSRSPEEYGTQNKNINIKT